MIQRGIDSSLVKEGCLSGKCLIDTAHSCDCCPTVDQTELWSWEQLLPFVSLCRVTKVICEGCSPSQMFYPTAISFFFFFLTQNNRPRCTETCTFPWFLTEKFIYGGITVQTARREKWDYGNLPTNRTK